MSENYNDNNYDDYCYDYYDSKRYDKLGIIIGIVLAVIVVFSFFSIGRKCVSTYNHIISMQKEVEFARSNVENHELTDSAEYRSLMDQLEGSVNRISIAREEYNEQVAIYNNSIAQFPKNILVGIFGFKKFEEFKADKTANNPNMVNFDE